MRASWRDPIRSVFRATDAPAVAASLGGPPTVDREVCAGDRPGRIRAKINREVGNLVDGDEFLSRLCRQQHVALDLFFGYAAGFRGVRNSTALGPELAKECGPLLAAVQYQIARAAGNAFFERAAII
jgi:hypothetical protein